MERIKKIKLGNSLIFICVLIFCILFINRLFYAIDTSDEAFYCTTGYRLIKGNIPFGDMWEPNAGTSFIMAPFLYLRSFFVSDGEGIVLYLRLCYFVLNLLPTLAIYRYAKLTVDKGYALLLGLFFLFYAPFQLVGFSYNNLAITFTTLSLCMLFMGMRTEKKIYYYLSGISIALAILAYPTMIYLGVVLFFVILLSAFFKQNSILSCLCFIIGGLFVSVPVILYLSCNVGMRNVFTNLSIISSIDNAHVLSFGHVIQKICKALMYFRELIVRNGGVFIGYWLIMITAIVKGKERILKYMILFYPLICCYCTVDYIANQPRYVANNVVMFYIFSIMLLFTIPLLCSKDRIKKLKENAFEWCLSLLLYFILSVSSGGGARNAICGLIFTCILIIIFLIKEADRQVNRISKMILGKEEIYTLILLIIGFEIFTFYQAPYSDSKMPYLTAKVESGIFKGIYTSPERKQHIEDLGNVIKSLENRGETLLVLYHSCYAYLMVDMIPKTPSSWGCYDYQAYKFDNQNLFMEYLGRRENIPKNIIVIDIPQQFDYPLEKAERYKPYYPNLNKYVDNHYNYHGTYEQGLSGKVMKYKFRCD